MYVSVCVCVHDIVWHGRVIGATKSAHPELGSLSIVVSIDEAVRRRSAQSMCASLNGSTWLDLGVTVTTVMYLDGNRDLPAT